MNNCQIQKIIFLCLTFSNIFISPSDARSLHRAKIVFSNKINHSNNLIDNSLILNSEIFKYDQLFASSENIKNLSSEIKQKETYNDTITSVANEIYIESKVQSETNNILYAQGEVIVKFEGNILKADSVVYNKKTKLAKAEGEIQININNQIFHADMVEYDFIKKKGKFVNVKGLINAESIISDFDFKSNSIFENLLSTTLRIQKDNVVFTPGKVTNWIFSTNNLKVNKNQWSSKKAFLTNDLLLTNQVKLQFNELKIYPNKERLKFKSKINYLILQDRVIIPFWLGDRTILKKSRNSNSYDSAFEFENKWNIGYDKLNKDGYFIGRKLDSIKINNDLFLKLEPQFFLERTLKGKTKSFVKKKYSLNSPRVERNIGLSDYFGLNSSIVGKIQNWDLKITKELNSFDLDKFANAFRTRAELSKEINFFNTTFVNRIFGAYRERIWNGSIGESEIHNAYGWQLDKTNLWENGSVKKNQIITFGLGNYKAEGLTNSDFVESYKGSISYQLNQKIPLYEKMIDSLYIDKSFEYIPEPIKQGIFIDSKIFINYNLYKNGNSQKYLGVGVGPEIVIGSFKKDFFDYTRIKVLPSYIFKSGNSIFKFDQVSEKFTVNLDFDQQLIGSWLIETKGILNLDNNSDDYGKFIYSRIGMNFKKRSYSFGIFYKPHDQSGGINFTLNGFK